MFATRPLGFQFIWVDSLCIIQDPRDDWRREAPLTQNIYRGALFNIAVTAAASGKHGCFTQRDPLLVKTFATQTV